MRNVDLDFANDARAAIESSVTPGAWKIVLVTALLLGAGVAVFLSWLILTLIRLWFDFSGGGSAVYGVIASFLGVLICLNFFSMAIVFGAHMAATVRLKPWREVLRSARTAKPPDGQVG